MKKILMIVITIAIALMSTDVEAKKKKEQKQTNPFGEVFEIPASERDTEEYFGGTGVAHGSIEKMDEVKNNAIANAQDEIRQKMKHSYKGFISRYSNTTSLKKGNDIQSKADREGEQIIEGIVNDAQVTKGPVFSYDDKGNITVFVGIRISKKETADKIAQALEEDEELKLMFKEEQFRKRMDEAFKKYKEGYVNDRLLGVSCFLLCASMF